MKITRSRDTFAAMFSLKDKMAVVTGAGSGIGAAIAVALAEHGARVVIAEKDEKSGKWHEAG